MVAQLFISDKLYVDWLAEHPEGYVANLRSTWSPHYIVLHKANCRTISPAHYSPGAMTERNYRKLGANDVDDILAWVKDNMAGANGFTKRCGHCCP